MISTFATQKEEHPVRKVLCSVTSQFNQMLVTGIGVYNYGSETAN